MPEPIRFRESAFRRYEHILKKVVEAFPNSIKFRPVELATETVACRLRDAVASFLRNKWESELDLEWFLKYWNDYGVAHDGVWITIGKKQGRNQVTECKIIQDSGGGPTGATRLSVDSPKGQVLAALCVLIADGVLTEPVRLTNIDSIRKVTFEQYLAKTYPNIILQSTNEPDAYLLL